MSNLVTLEGRANPWHPTASTVDGPVLNFYDVPLAGLFSQDWHHFLYQCILGHIDDVGIWVYTPIADGERAKLETAVSPKLQEELQKLRDGRKVTVALAVSDHILMSENLVSGSDATLIHRALEACESLLKVIQRVAIAV
ncbi:hypothetical protein [Frankia sp. Cr2]|uniref:hypothetical protein n=1 Tax=Frankia sp. Cr2 TaxID=3073932 RepID=UPI002AD3FFEE|nr:hypothetical protein [Frankia sp. Cr2]